MAFLCFAKANLNLTRSKSKGFARWSELCWRFMQSPGVCVTLASNVQCTEGECTPRIHLSVRDRSQRFSMGRRAIFIEWRRQSAGRLSNLEGKIRRGVHWPAPYNGQCPATFTNPGTPSKYNNKGSKTRVIRTFPVWCGWPKIAKHLWLTTRM